MQCKFCKAQIATGMAYCPTCGAATSYKASNSEVLPYSPTIPAALYDAPLQAPPPPTTVYGSPPYEAPSLNPYEPFSPHKIPPPQQYFSRQTVALIVGSILLLIIASSSIYYAVVFRPNQLHAQPTPSLARTPPPAPFTYTSEAEASTNVVIGGASIDSCPACSGGQKVGYVGNNSGALQFNDINVRSADTYTLTIYYCSAETRDAFMSINGNSGVQLLFSSTGDWNIPGPLIVSIKLNAGSNAIKFYNPSGWAPDFDRIIVKN